MKRLLIFILISFLVHLVLLLSLAPLWDDLTNTSDRIKPTSKITLTLSPPPPPKKTEDKEEEEPPDPKGQIVDLPEPKIEEVPKKADYVAEHNHKVDKETKTKNYRVNPEIVAPTYQNDDQLRLEEAVDVNSDERSSGATVGNDSFKPEEDGNLSHLPSPFKLTNLKGLQKPTISSSTSSALAGAPNNDLLNETLGDAVNLNAKEWVFASYMNQIRRAVNFYWIQNTKNLNVPLRKPLYLTEVVVTLHPNGALDNVKVKTDSGVYQVDDCVTEAFHNASPFPQPPDALVSKDKKVHLPLMGFNLKTISGKASYQGVDPRASIRFPGLLKTNR